MGLIWLLPMHVTKSQAKSFPAVSRPTLCKRVNRCKCTNSGVTRLWVQVGVTVVTDKFSILSPASHPQRPALQFSHHFSCVLCVCVRLWGGSNPLGNDSKANSSISLNSIFRKVLPKIMHNCLFYFMKTERGQWHRCHRCHDLVLVARTMGGWAFWGVERQWSGGWWLC